MVEACILSTVSYTLVNNIILVSIFIYLTKGRVMIELALGILLVFMLVMTLLAPIIYGIIGGIAC